MIKKFIVLFGLVLMSSLNNGLTLGISPSGVSLDIQKGQCGNFYTYVSSINNLSGVISASGEYAEWVTMSKNTFSVYYSLDRTDSIICIPKNTRAGNYTLYVVACAYSGGNINVCVEQVIKVNVLKKRVFK